MVTDNFGREKWEEICARAGTEDVFVGMEYYPDEVTLKLMGAACDVFGIAQFDLLRNFGQWWVGFANEVYSDLFTMSGSTFIEFVKNLNDLHTRVARIMPKLNPPSFEVLSESEDSFELHYRSIRPGLLYPMVFGLIEGIGKHFNTEIRVTYLGGSDKGLDYEKYHVWYRA